MAQGMAWPTDHEMAQGMVQPMTWGIAQPMMHGMVLGDGIVKGTWDDATDDPLNAAADK